LLLGRRRGLHRAVTLELLLLAPLPLGFLGLALLLGAPEGPTEARRVAVRDGRRVALRIDPELLQATQDLLVVEAGLLGKFVDADLVAHAFSLLTVPTGTWWRSTSSASSSPSVG